MILRRFRPRSHEATIRDLYGTIVAQARSAAFYSAYGVPDTVQGRFDLIVLHLVLLLARFDRDCGAKRGIGRTMRAPRCGNSKPKKKARCCAAKSSIPAPRR